MSLVTFGGDQAFWVVELRDVDGTKLHEVQSGEFAGVVRRNAPGQWRVRVPLDELSLPTALNVRQVLVRDRRRVLFAGWVSPLPSGGGGVTRSRTDDEQSLVFEGVDAWWPLTARVCWPNPVTGIGALADVRSGVGSTVAAEYIEHNLGQFANAQTDIERQAAIIVVDPEIGDEGEWSARWLPLSKMVGRVCDESGIVCAPSIAVDGRPEFRFVTVTDRTDSLVLVDDDDLASAVWSFTPPRATWVFALGQGEGASRVAALAFPFSGGGLDRFEFVTEQVNASTPDELRLIANAVLADSAPFVSVDAELSSSIAQRLRYGIDYQLGDKLGVQVDGERYPSPVTAVRFEVTPERSQATPVLGTWSPERLQGLRRDVLGLADRFNNNIA